MVERQNEASVQATLMIRRVPPAQLWRATIWGRALWWVGQSDDPCPFIPVSLGLGSQHKCWGLGVRGDGVLLLFSLPVVSDSFAPL